MSRDAASGNSDEKEGKYEGDKMAGDWTKNYCMQTKKTTHN